MLDLTREETFLIGCALEDLRENSRAIAADRDTSKEYRGMARQQVKIINALMHKIDRETAKYPEGKPFSIVNL